ncbi:MAG TPA: N,N-dimethylformamidase beta subunit family domain-containing protein [Nitrospira sp.]
MPVPSSDERNHRTRRQFLSSALAISSLALFRPSIIGACSVGRALDGTCAANSWLDGGRLPVEGYAERRSYVAGERVSLFMSSQNRTRAIVTIERVGAIQEIVWSAPVWVEPKAIPSDASEHGCRWEGEERADVSFEIPADWPSGFYRVSMNLPFESGNRRGEAFFAVRSATPGQNARILLVLSTNTYFAYNNFGRTQATEAATTQGSFYDHTQVASFHRPLPLGFLSPYECRPGEAQSRQHRYAGWDKWEWPFVQWAEREGIALDYAVNEDLERYPDLLSKYRLVLSVGHDEYWSERMRNALDRFIRRGGNVAFFSGNVCYRQVTLDVHESRLVLQGDMDGTALWSHRQGPQRPENLLTGVSFCYGALNPDPVPYTIYQPNHWVFDNIWPGRWRSKQFPQVGCIGYECDGCDVAWENGVPRATHRDGTPENFQILGLAPGRMPDYEAGVHSKALFGLDGGVTPWGTDLRQGHAIFGLWSGEGTVLTVGCTEWAKHLDDPIVAQITKNVIHRLSR